MCNFLLCLYYCSYFFQFFGFTRISKFFLKMLKVHQKKMVIINFANKWEIITKVLCQVKKNRGEILVGKKKVGEKLSHLQKIQLLFPTFFSPIRYIILAKNTVISPNFKVWKFCGNAQYPHKFGRFARNYAETMRFHKISTPGNQVKLRYFTQQLRKISPLQTSISFL